MIVNNISHSNEIQLKQFFGRYLVKTSEKTRLKYFEKEGLGAVELCNQTLIRNLGRVDTILPVLISELIAKNISSGMENWNDLLDKVVQFRCVEKRIGISFGKDHLHYSIKKLLLAFAAGMNSDELWHGQYGVSLKQLNGIRLDNVSEINFSTLANILFNSTKLKVLSEREADVQNSNINGLKGELFYVFGIQV